MKTEILKEYIKFRQHSPFMLAGRNSELALMSAKTLVAFRQAEADGLVRMRCEPEEENYFDVYGRDGTPAELKRMEEIIERLGCWWTVAEWFDGSEWNQADSCGMHAGYKNPLDPFENCYVIDEMRSALDAAPGTPKHIARNCNCRMLPLKFPQQTSNQTKIMKLDTFQKFLIVLGVTVSSQLFVVIVKLYTMAH